MSITERIMPYKVARGVELRMHLFVDDMRPPDALLPAVIFFHGGGWTAGTPEQFFPQCRYLASMGMVACSAAYRLITDEGGTVVECVKDAKSAVRWVRAHADRLGVDTNRVAAGGGSAGGHLAACTGVIGSMNDESDDVTVSSKPDALILFNPALDMTPPKRAEKCGGAAHELSPVHHVRRGVPPTIIFHGEDDELVPISEAERYTAAMTKAGNGCELVAYPGAGHGFFNYFDGDNPFYAQTLREADRFLCRLGWLSGEPTIGDAP